MLRRLPIRSKAVVYTRPNAAVNAMKVGQPGHYTIYISGVTVGRDWKSKANVKEDATAQATQVFGKIQEVLAEAGATMSDVVKIHMFLTNIEETLQEVISVRRQFFPGIVPPTTAVEVRRLASPQCLMEIEVTAVTDR